MDVATGNIPNEVRAITERMKQINHAFIYAQSNGIFASETIQLSLRYGSVFIGLVSCILFILLLVCKKTKE